MSTDQLESELRRFEALRRQAAAAMVALIGEVDRRQVPLADGSRSTREWVAGRLDVPADEARVLTDLSRSLEDLPETARRLATGEIGPSRAHLMSGLAGDASEEEWLDRLDRYDLSGAQRVAARHRRISRRQERRRHRDSYLSLQPSLDESWWRISGGVGAVAGQVISSAIRQKADELPADAGPVEHRQALALEQICQGDADSPYSSGGTTITAFLDMNEAAATGGQAGGELAFGPRLGPDALEELLCEGRVSIVGLWDGNPVVTSPRTARIPPAIRDFVLWRDGGCRAPGCTSRHRLQPHHIVPRSHQGSHHPDNLATLCWYHHHVVVHRRGYRIERHRGGAIRFVHPADSRDPPR